MILWEPIKLRFFRNKMKKGTPLLTVPEGVFRASERLLILTEGLLNKKRTACSIYPDREGKKGWNNHRRYRREGHPVHGTLTQDGTDIGSKDLSEVNE